MEERVKQRLQSIDNYDFEHFVGDLWERMGWQTTVSQESVDAGIDVIATKSTPFEQKAVIQAKRYGENTTVGGPDVQQYASLKQQVPGADTVIIVTTNTFTRAARDRASDLNVKLVDGDGIMEMIDDLDAHDLLEKYSSVLQERSTHAAVDGGSATAQVEPTMNVGDPLLSASRDGRLWELEQEHDWHQYAAYSAVGWILTFFLGGFASVFQDIWGLVCLVMLVVWYMDIRYIRHQTQWDPTAWKYLLAGVVFPYISLPVYFYRRKKMVGEWW